ncbi:retrovirus-related Pol polyprotein from transposon 297 [Trichonephila clavipes]|nr:retrovirus-related Pol polyprotein from transposon 297 [Trichonephila clavipes]
MALSDSLPQINLDVQGRTQGGSNSGAQRVNPEFRVGSNFRIIPEQYFSGVENVVEILENMDNNLTYYEIPTQLARAYLKGHLTGRALDWFEILGYRVVEDKATDYAHLKQALTEQFPVVSQEFRDTDQSAGNRFPNKNKQENWRETRGNNRYSDNSRPQMEFNRFEGQGVADNRRFDSRRRCDQSDHRFHNQGGRQCGIDFMKESKLTLDFDKKSLIIPDDQIKQLPKVEKPVEIDLSNTKLDQPGLTHVLYHEIDTGDQGPIVSRPYCYDRVKQGIIDYRIEKMLQEGTIRPIQSPYASPVVLTRKNNGLPSDSPEAYRYAIDYRKLNAITKYPRYPLPVFALLRDAGLTLNKDKCHFARDKLKYLGLIISKEGIETDNKKVKGITEMKPPKNNKEVSKFLGMAGWYQKFIPHYADICEPLYRLKKKGAKFNWSTEAQNSFIKVKRALTEAPVLQLPNFQEQFNLFTDASRVGIGAVYYQNQRPIAFTSRTLNKAERNYTVTERECLAVIWALNEFRTYFGSLPVKVITDHAALTLTNGKNLSCRIIRWALKLSEFNIEWEH